MTPHRLAVTREQTHSLIEWRHPDARHTLRLPERPTWTCASCQGVGSSPSDHVGNCPDCDGHGSMLIPEGTRVQIGWWEDPVGIVTASLWHPVATATIDEVAAPLYDDELWIVVLTDVEATDVGDRRIGLPPGWTPPPTSTDPVTLRPRRPRPTPPGPPRPLPEPLAAPQTTLGSALLASAAAAWRRALDAWRRP